MTTPSKFISTTYQSKDLVDIFPVTQCLYRKISNPADELITEIITINHYGTNNYSVYTSLYTTDTDPNNDFYISSVTGRIIIHSKTATNFEVAIDFNLNDSFDFYLVFMLVYNNVPDIFNHYISRFWWNL